MRASGWVLWSKLSRIQSLSFVIGKTSEARLRTTSFRSDEEGIITIWQLEVCLKITGDEVYTYRFRVIISLMQILSFLPDAPYPSKKRKTTEKQMNSFDAVNIYSECSLHFLISDKCIIQSCSTYSVNLNDLRNEIHVKLSF